MGKQTERTDFASLASANVTMELEKYDELTAGDDHAEESPLNAQLIRRSWFELQRISLLGQGVFSNVYLVVDSKTRKQYALKCLDARSISNSEEFLDAASDLARETALLARLDHENIIQLRGYSSSTLSESYQEGGNGFFFLMDVLQGTLKDRLERWRSDKSMFQVSRRFLFRGRPAIDVDRMYGRIETVALGIVRGMRYLHEQQAIVLRDLKPANIGFDSESGQVRLFDFGMSRPIHQCLVEEVVGTPRYMAPEVMMSKGTSFASDVYSFGVVLYEICSLQVAFSKQRDLEDFQRHVVDARARPSLSSIPCPSLQALISACWAHEPADRPSFSDIHRILLEIVEPSVDKLVPIPPRRLERKRSSSVMTRTTHRMELTESFGEDESNRGETMKTTLLEEFSALGTNEKQMGVVVGEKNS